MIVVENRFKQNNIAILNVPEDVACVASVSVEQRAKNGVFGGFRHEKWGESKNKKEGVGEGREGRKRLQPSIVILKTAHLACHA